MRRSLTSALLALTIFGSTGLGAEPATSVPANPPTVSRLADSKAVRTRLGLLPAYDDLTRVESIKVAVLDYGFEGMGRGRPYLPEGAVVVEHYEPEFVRRNGLGDPQYRKPFEPGNSHGRTMAQIVWAVTGSRSKGPKFFLLNANGPTMLRRAVRYAIEERVDLILFSGSFEGGGDGDGRGPINRVVSDAVGAGIIWINAAGNYGHRVYNGPIRPLADGYLRLRDGSDVASLRLKNRVDENTLTVTLTWNDYRGDEDSGTNKDLDLYVEDWAGRRVGSGEKVQVAGDRAAGSDESRNPRERVVLTDLAANPDAADSTYRIRVRAKSGRFAADDRIRILVTATHEGYVPVGGNAPVDAIEFVDASGSGEVFPPADHPLVLTVGDGSPGSSIGPTADGRIKPEVIIEDSRAYFTDGQASAGSSNAAAYFAGIVAVLKAAEPGLLASDVRRISHRGVAIRRAGKPGEIVPALTTAEAARDGSRLWTTPSRAALAGTVRGGR